MQQLEIEVINEADMAHGHVIKIFQSLHHERSYFFSEIYCCWFLTC